MATVLKNELSNRDLSPAGPQEARQGGRKHPFRTGFIVGAVVTVAMTMLIIQNGERAKVEWFILDFEWPLWVVLLLSFVAGMVAWQLFLHKVRQFHRVRETTERARSVIPFKKKN
jgi:uncharacterized integral membrane protein